MPNAPALTTRQIARLRLKALGLAGAEAGSTPLEVVEHHLAMQAQDFRASRWAIGSRIAGSTDAEVIAAFDRGEIVRSWPMRGTVHVTPARDLPWMLGLLSPPALSGAARRREQLGLTEADLEHARAAAVDRLTGGRQATRDELGEAFAEAGLDLSGQRRYHTIWYLSQTGTLVQGPVVDGDHALVLLDEWIPEPRRLEREEALRELGRRYLRARGPATVEDLVHWTKLPKRDARLALQPADGDIVQVEGPGGPYRILAEHLAALDPEDRTPDRKVLALAAFDEHLLGYRVRDAVLDPAHAQLVDPGRNGVFRWTIVAGGRVVATWKRIRRTHHTLVEVVPFRPLPRRVEGALPAALEGWARFEGVEIEVRVASP